MRIANLQDELPCENSKMLGAIFSGVPSNCKNAHTMTPVPGTKFYRGIFATFPPSISFISYFLSRAAFLGDVRIVQP